MINGIFESISVILKTIFWHFFENTCHFQQDVCQKLQSINFRCNLVPSCRVNPACSVYVVSHLDHMMLWPELQWTLEFSNLSPTWTKTPGRGGGTLASNGLLGMCCWMGLHFHDSTDYNEVASLSIFNRVTMGSHFLGTLRVTTQKWLRWSL